MKSKDLIAILEILQPNAEIVITVNDITTGKHLGDTYDIGYSLNSTKELRLIVAVEAADR